MSTEGGSVLAGRDATPSHYLFKIESFSLLSKASIEKLILDKFEAGGYKCGNLRSKREVMAVAGKCIELIEGVEMAEAEPMKFGIQIAIDVGLASLMIESDSLTLVKLMTFKVSFVPRTANIAAHNTARLATNFRNSVMWNLSVHLTGNKSLNVTDHISIYLELAETSSLPTGWEVNAIINFFIFNQVQDKYFGLQDVRVKHFHAMKSKYGVAKFIDLKTFSNPVNGYLINDACVFGAEVFVVKKTFKGERLSMMRDPPTYYHTWKVTNFSRLLDEFYESESFGCYKWKILLFPNGNAECEGNCISLFLDVCRSSIPPNIKLLTKFILCVEDQMNGKNIELKAECLHTPTNRAFGDREFMTLAKLKDPKEGYLVDDSCIIKAEVTLHGVVLAET